MKILASGGLGFIGGHFVDALIARGDSVVDIDMISYASWPYLAGRGPNYRHIKARLQDMRIEHAGSGYDALVHLAAESHVCNSIVNPRRFVESNVLGAASILEIARALKIPRIVWISTDEVTGPIGRNAKPLDDTASMNPTSPYAAAKAGAELLAQAYAKTYGMPIIIVRPCNTYGPRQYPEKLVPRTICRILDGRPVEIHGDGSTIREWMYVDDCVAALLAILDDGKFGQIYCPSSENGKPVIEVAQHIAKVMGGTIEFVTDRPANDFRYAVDSGKVRALGWAPRVGLEEGLTETIEWYGNNKDKWRAAITRGGKY